MTRVLGIRFRSQLHTPSVISGTTRINSTVAADNNSIQHKPLMMHEEFAVEAGVSPAINAAATAEPAEACSPWLGNPKGERLHQIVK